MSIYSNIIPVILLATSTLLIGCSQSSLKQDKAIPSKPLPATNSRFDGSILSLDVKGKTLKLRLQPNTFLLSKNIRVIKDDQPSSLSKKKFNLPYRGYVQGKPDSWVRLQRNKNNEFTGLVFQDKQLYELRTQKKSGQLMFAQADLNEYMLDGQASEHQHHLCGTEEKHDKTKELKHQSHVVNVQSNECRQVPISLVADFTYVQALGGATKAEEEMLKRMNEIDGIYRDQLNIGFSVTEVRTFSTEGGPAFNYKSAGSTPLDEFSKWKKENRSQDGLSHLFVQRVRTGTVGLAWVGTVCRSSHGTGVSNYLGSGRASTLVAAHELGHNFSAGHDSKGAQYIMAPSVARKATGFSSKSKKEMERTRSLSCLIPCSDTPNQPKPPTEPERPIFTGNVKAYRSSFQPSQKGFQHNGGSIEANLSSDARGDFDLYLQVKNSAGRWVDVAESIGDTSNEIIKYNGTSGMYRWEVYAYSGSGNYKITTK